MKISSSATKEGKKPNCVYWILKTGEERSEWRLWGSHTRGSLCLRLPHLQHFSRPCYRTLSVQLWKDSAVHKFLEGPCALQSCTSAASWDVEIEAANLSSKKETKDWGERVDADPHMCFQEQNFSALALTVTRMKRLCVAVASTRYSPCKAFWNRFPIPRAK